MGGAADKAGNRYERRWTLLALLDLLAGTAQSVQVEVPGEKGAGAEFLQVMADGVPVWHQVKRQQASGPWTIASLVNGRVIEFWWPKVSSGGRFVFVSSTGAQELAELVERARAADSWLVFDQDFLASAANRKRFERLCQAWGDQPGAEVHAALRNIEVRQISEPDLKGLLEARLLGLVDGSPLTAMAVLEQFIDDSTHRRLTAPEIWKRLAEHDLRPRAEAGAGGSGSEQVQTSGPVIQRAESSGRGNITQVAGDYIVQPRGNTRQRETSAKRRKILLASGVPVIVAIVVAIMASASSPSPDPARPGVQPLSGYARMQLQAIQVPLTSQLAEQLGLSGATRARTVTGYEFRNAQNKSAPACLGALTTGSDAGQSHDPVRAVSCSTHAASQIWIPAQWEHGHQGLTWLVNDQYPSMCLNTNKALGDGSAAQLWSCYHNPYGPNGLAVNEAWDFGNWYAGMTSTINPYPLFLGTSGFCLGATAQKTSSNLPDGAEVDIQTYSHMAANQYWS